jgi:hypothetical protein
MSKQGEPMRSKRRLNLVLFALVGLFVTVSADVFAIVGRPATPVSYAGAARRSVRRHTY